LEITSDIYFPDVFLSYGGPDAEFVKRVARDLEAQGIRVWFAEWDLDYGDDIVQSIESGLLKSKKFVIVVSPEALERPWVKKELSAAFSQAIDGPGKLIIPLMHKKSRLPPFLASHRWMDFTLDENYPLKIQELTRRLKGKAPARRLDRWLPSDRHYP
jgi:hypothetical protein